MPWKPVLYALLLSLAYNRSPAQAFDSSYIIPESAVRNTYFKAFLLADSFSKVGDSVQASACLQRIDPYFLIQLAFTPANLDTFFSEYKLTISAKEVYRKNFEVVYDSPRTEAYKMFEEMFYEDREVRNKLGMSGDSFTTAVSEQKMMQTDSIHFDYLYKYIKKFGWPKLANGGRYAEFLALHDGTEGHWMYYLPIMKKAVIDGQASYMMYNTILNRAMKPDWLELAKKYKNKSVFDVSCILKMDTPAKAQMDLMKKAVKEHKPIKYICFLYESDNEKDFNQFKMGGWDANNYWIAWDLMVHLEIYQSDLLFTDDHNIPYQFAYSQSSIKRNKLLLYLLY